MGTHFHHIIPKHMGGTDDPSNLVELTVREHAIAHLKLFEEHGNWKDLFAYKALTGQIETDDIRRELAKLGRTGSKHSPESIQKIKDANIYDRIKDILYNNYKLYSGDRVELDEREKDRIIKKLLANIV